MANDGVSKGQKRSVTIFGAGVAGLTAAHELVERGLDVEVIDPDIREEIHTLTRDRGIGGMARSQWGCWFDELPSKGTSGVAAPPRLETGEDLLLNDVIVFDPASKKPTDPVHAGNVLDKVVRLIRRLVRADEPGQLDLTRASELMIMAPFTPPAPSGDYRIDYVKKELARKLAKHAEAVAHIEVELPDPDVLQVPNQPANMNGWLFFVLPELNVFPAEHGFRFFPSFYRHVFDSLKRIPILNHRRHERTIPTVRENLIPCEGLGFARPGTTKSFLIQRREMKSLETVRNYLRLVLSELEYSLSDINRFGLKLFKYMTSCTERRAGEYEDMSWGRFVEQKKYSRVSRRHIEYGPQMSAALRGSKSDARTQGNISVQLLMDQFRADSQPDCTLNGPTNTAWLDHWHDYLSMQRVRFRRGTLADFYKKDGEVLPRVYRNVTKDERGETVLDTSNELAVSGDYFIIALSLPAAAKVAEKFLKVAELGPDNDFERILELTKDLEEDLKLAAPVGPLQHLSGIQFYFDVEINFWRGHTQYLDSEWGLTSIAQPQFWGRRRDRTDAYRSILSVDIGIWDRAYEGKKAWDCTPDEIAAYAWEQIADHHDDAFQARYGKSQPLPVPIAYALDANIAFSSPKIDKTPFLVNRVGDYPKRPGRLVGDTDKPMSKQISLYDVHLGKYVLVGTYMKTYTRLTSMEGANESARHGVNAILTLGKVPCDRSEIWDPEDNEILDLQWLRDLDKKRFEEGRPHIADSLGCLDLSDLDVTPFTLWDHGGADGTVSR